MKEGCDSVGADIHCHVEVKDTGTNEWKEVRIPNPYHLSYDYDRNTDQISDEATPNLMEPFDGRNYSLFGILAGVRSNVFKQMDDPRGLPSDVSDSVLAAYKDSEYDWHTPSWYTLDELYAWLDKKKNFKLPVYDGEDDSWAKEESKAVREVFRYFVFGVDFMANLMDPFVRRPNARVVFWFDS